MNTDLKKLILIFGGGLVIFWAFQKLKPIGASKSSSKTSKKSKKSEPTPEQKKDAVIMLKAYSDAKNAGEKPDFLREMNQEFMTKYQMKVMGDKTTGKYIVVNNEGDKVI
jgi:hypothetical protein